MLVSIPTKHDMGITNIALVFHEIHLYKQLWKKKKSNYNKKQWSALFESLPVLSLFNMKHLHSNLKRKFSENASLFEFQIKKNL